MNIYGFVGNNPQTKIDLLGLHDNASPWEVGWEWLTGSETKVHHFDEDDDFTALLKQHKHVERVRAKIRAQLEAQCSSCDSTTLRSNMNYSLAGLQGVYDYVQDYSVLFTAGLTAGNLAGTYLGGYKLDYETKKILCRKGIAKVHFHVYNSSTMESATHPPIIGYTEWWHNYIGVPLNNYFASGPLSKIEQTFDWDELIDFKANPCCNK